MFLWYFDGKKGKGDSRLANYEDKYQKSQFRKEGLDGACDKRPKF